MWILEIRSDRKVYNSSSGGFDDGTGRKKRNVDFEKKNYNTNPDISELKHDDEEYDIDEKLYNYDY